MSKELEVNAPKVIYLQIGDDHEGEYSDEATWCADKIHNTDIAYVLRSDYAELAAKLAQAEATLAELRKQEPTPKGFIVVSKDLLAEAIACNTDASLADARHIINSVLKVSDDEIFREALKELEKPL